MLVDDTDDANSRSLEYLALKTMREGFEGRVAASHCGAMAGYNDVYAAKVVDMVATAGVTISVNAHINLVCSARLDREPKRRGIARVKELLARGANVVTSQDDVNDPYYPFGKPDPLECASMMAHVAQLTLPHELEQVMDMITVNARKARPAAGLRHRARHDGRPGGGRRAVRARGPAPAAAAATRVQGRPRSRAFDAHAGTAWRNESVRSWRKSERWQEHRSEPRSVRRNGTLVIPGVGQVKADVGIADGKIVAIGENLEGAGGRNLRRDRAHSSARHFRPAHPYRQRAVLRKRSRDRDPRGDPRRRHHVGIFLRSLEDSYFDHLPAFRKAMDERSYVDSVFHPQIFTEKQIEEIPGYAEQFGIRSFKFYMSGMPGIVKSVTDDVLLHGFRTVASLGPDAVACVHCETGALIDARAQRT